MGLGGGLVRKVFFKSQSSPGARDCNERTCGVDRGRWSSVRVYFCGDEFNTLLTEDDLASVKNSETTVMQPVDDNSDEESCPETNKEGFNEPIAKEESSATKLFGKEEAAIFIQSAFRGFMARQQYKEIQGSGKSDGIQGAENSSVANEAASTEVLVGDSTENFNSGEETVAIPHRVLQKARSQVYRLKEDWDDSTVSRDVSKLKIQYRLEATSRRERALAYAFSQQLRICTTKKKPAWSDSTTEPNTGWSWLERWMATRVPENSLVEDCWSKHHEPISSYRKPPPITKKRFDVSVEEKESCGSNDVSVSFDGFTMPSQSPDGYGPVRSKLNAAGKLSRRKMLPEYQKSAQSRKVSKKDSLGEAEKEKRCKRKQVQPKSREETHCKDASQAPSDYQN